MLRKKDRKSLSGHLFTAFLACPQRAWLDIRGDGRLRLASPTFLRAMQADGIKHESAVEKEYFGDAVRIPSSSEASMAERVELTRKTMAAGAAHILQACIETETGMGVLDVLERVGSSSTSISGSLYRVGEIKRAKSLQTGHVFQTLWYRQLLEEFDGDADGQVFFITGDMKRQTVSANYYRKSYATVLRKISNMENGAEPGPHLCSLCPTCSWRGVCMQRLVSREEVSLMPCISRSQADILTQNGIAGWREIAADIDRTKSLIGLGGYQESVIRQAANRIAGRGAVTRSLLNPATLLELDPVWVDIADEDAGYAPPPLIVCRRNGVDIEIAVDPSNSDLLERSLGARPAAVYGRRELEAVRRAARSCGARLRREPITLLEVLERHLHEPILGLELAEIDGYASGRESVPSLDGREERLDALDRSIEWLAGVI